MLLDEPLDFEKEDPLLPKARPAKRWQSVPILLRFLFFWVPIDLRGWSGCQVLSSIFGQLYFWRVWSGLE